MHEISYKKITIYEVNSFVKELNEYLSEEKKSYALNMKDVEKIDMTAVQAILSADKSCKEKGAQLLLYDLNNDNRDILELCGCNWLLGDNR